MFGLNLKPKSSSTTTTTTDSSTGMGMLLVLFPQDKSTTNKLTSLSPSKSLLSKTQSTISICALLLFTTLLLFTISTIPTTTITPPSSSSTPRRRTSLLQKPTFALQKMGTLYRRGTRAMPDLLICHVADETPTDDFRLFLRLLHRSSLTASTDVIFIFSSPSSTSTFSPIVLQENQAFLSLLHSYSHLNRTHALNSTFRPTRFLHKGKQVGSGEPLWGPKTRSNSSSNSFTKISYGSVLSFDATELDPENSLSGFLDRVPLSLRRWACYPMLLGRVRRNFKHVMLVDAKNVLVQSDPLGRVRTRSPESVLLFTKHGRMRQSGVSPAVVMGGARGVRRLAGAVVVEIVRAATQQHRKRKNPVTDSSVLSQLASNEFTLRNKSVRLMDSAESIPEFGSSHNSGATSSFSDYAIIQRGSGNHDVNSVIKKQMCSSVVDSSVYRDC
ncbi:uncharacterized protein LOC130730163 [Lotus japonicus]|uniref:uncharacterized protein LOC130730163 n=1 Tax=Lotus japonicus TaxID=34305 RepID=UPI002584FA03|nr:uncharacterized protein LOC130730163 [Lotus japonicus]